jgi:hypothetical protein
MNRLIALNPLQQKNPIEQFARGQQTRLNLDLAQQKMGQAQQNQMNTRRQEALQAIATFGPEGAAQLGYNIDPQITEYFQSPEAMKQLKRQFKQDMFEGSSMDAQALNILQSGDPSSRQYAMAYEYYTTPKTQFTPEGPVTITPTLPEFVQPPAGKQDQAQTREAQVRGGIQKVEGMQKLSPNQLKYNTARDEALNLVDAYNNYMEVAQRLIPDSPSDYVRMVRNNPEQFAELESAYANLQLASKGKGLFDLGVLSGPDEMIIERTMMNPLSAKGVALGKQAVLTSAAQTGKQIGSKLKNINTRFKGGQVKTSDIPEIKEFKLEQKETKTRLRFDAQGNLIE